jgi:5-methylcytosine-specific restriction endonuclease McrA
MNTLVADKREIDEMLTNPYVYLDRNNPEIRRKMRNTRMNVISKWNLHFGGLICAYCLKDLDINEKTKNAEKYPTIDHIIPLYRGGSLTSFDNLVVSCYKCNLEKGNSIWKPIYYFVDTNGRGKWEINTI